MNADLQLTTQLLANNRQIPLKNVRSGNKQEIASCFEPFESYAQESNGKTRRSSSVNRNGLNLNETSNGPLRLDPLSDVCESCRASVNRSVHPVVNIESDDHPLPSTPSGRLSVGMTFRDFCSSTSLHGWQYLDGLDYSSGRYIWMVIVIASLGVASVFIVTAITDFINKFVVTTIDTTTASLQVFYLKSCFDLQFFCVHHFN